MIFLIACRGMQTVHELKAVRIGNASSFAHARNLHQALHVRVRTYVAYRHSALERPHVPYGAPKMSLHEYNTEWGCRDGMHHAKNRNPLSNTIKDTSTIMRNPFALIM